MRGRAWWRASFGEFLEETGLVLEKLYGISSDDAQRRITESDYLSRGESSDLYPAFVAESQESMMTPALTARAISELKPKGA